MKIYFECTFDSDTKQVKLFLKENGYNLVSKLIKKPNTIVIDSVSKEYSSEKYYHISHLTNFTSFG